MQREDALDTLAVRNLADREALVEAAAGAGDAHALVGLHAGALAFDDFYIDLEGVARLEVGHLLAEAGDLLAIELFDDVHGQKLLPWRGPVSPAKDFGILL